MSWRLNAVDKEGPFAWTGLSNPSQYKTTVEKLANFETMSENELQQAGCHFIETRRLCKEARDRLIHLELDDIDEVYSLRLQGTVRIFCVYRQQYLRVLWYDPDHKVCPSQKKRNREV